MVYKKQYLALYDLTNIVRLVISYTGVATPFTPVLGQKILSRCFSTPLTIHTSLKILSFDKDINMSIREPPLKPVYCMYMF